METRSKRGGDVIHLDHAGGRATIALKGAHITSWIPADQSRDVLWCSPLSPFGGNTAIRGGIPLCWPWFGPHTTDPERPQHGYARNLPWTPLGVDRRGDRVSTGFELLATDCPDRLHDLDAEVSYIFDPERLTIRLTSRNNGATAVPLSFAAHTYFAVSDVGTVAIEGLDGATYRDNTRSGAATQQFGPLHIAAETIALFDDAPNRQTFVDPGLNRRIAIERSGPGSTIVWNPGTNAATMADIPAGEAQRFLCVESGCIGTRTLTLEPGGWHTFTTSLRVRPVTPPPVP